MSQHLSPEQFARGVTGRSTPQETEHIGTCVVCRDELDRVGRAISSFRGAVRGRIDHHMPSTAQDVPPIPAGAGHRRWAPAAAAVALLVAGSLSRTEVRPRAPVEEASPVDADALMNAVNFHLSRAMPTPMEPILTLFPDVESLNESEGVQ